MRFNTDGWNDPNGYKDLNTLLPHSGISTLITPGAMPLIIMVK